MSALFAVLAAVIKIMELESLKTFLFILHLYLFCTCSCVWDAPVVAQVEVSGPLPGSAPFFCYLGLRDQVQMVRLSGKHLYLLSTNVDF